MKLTHLRLAGRKAGMTLLELTVVILVLLSLIAILFVGARAWKKGSDRSANIMNIRNCQQAMRGHENMRGLAVGGTFGATQLAEYMRMPANIGTDVLYVAGTLITPQSASPAADDTHLWLRATGGMPGDSYGHTAVTETTGW